jgi:NAD(P)-dependent dehydrogenase (short-subunit alcohol dehydrogenase family)
MSGEPTTASKRFDSQVVWVTGAGRGIGRAVASRFGAEGAAVLCIDIDRESADAAASEIRSAGGTALAACADVTDWDQIEQAAALGLERLGPAQIIVANAGLSADESYTVEETPVEIWEYVIRVCLTGAFHTAKAAVPQIRTSGPGGSIVFMSSTFGLCGVSEFPCYNAAKHGVIGLMRSLANQVADYDIRVTAVCPGVTDTPALDYEAKSLNMSRAELVKAESATQLFARLVEPDEIANAVLWLCSDEAAMVTGIEFPVDGGYMVRRRLREERS